MSSPTGTTPLAFDVGFSLLWLALSGALIYGWWLFFPVTSEHRDQSGPNISYADNYKGNALAGMISPDRIEIRYHQDFIDEQVSEILSRILSHEQLACIAKYEALYQGRQIRTR